MDIKFDNGQLTVAFDRACIAREGNTSHHDDGLRIQFYWPHFFIKNYKKGEKHFERNHKEFFFNMATRFRFVFEDVYWGIGGEFLGFGIGIDYQWEG